MSRSFTCLWSAGTKAVYLPFSDVKLKHIQFLAAMLYTSYLLLLSDNKMHIFLYN